VLAGAFGLFFALCTPAHDPPDEARHHARAWLISEGRLGVVGEAPGHEATVPRGITRLHPPGHHYTDDEYHWKLALGAGRRAPSHAPGEAWRRFAGHLDPEDRQAAWILTPYPPHLYAPYLPSLWLARALDLSAGAGLLLARLSGLACWLAGILVCLRVAPSQRWLLAAVALLPMSVFQAASVSADPLTQVAVFWFTAEWLRAAERGDHAHGLAAQRGDRARVLAAAFAVGLAKPGYAPVALACLLLPGSWRRRLGTTAAALALATAPTLAWLPFLRAAREPAMIEGADLVRQLRFVLEHPLAFASAVVETTRFHALGWLEGLVGWLGHFDVTIPPAATALGLLAVAGGATLDRGSLRRGERVGLPAVFALTSLALLGMAYLGWSPVGADKILGFQSRYLLPILPLALVAIPRLPSVPERSVRWAVSGSLALVLTVSAAAMLRAYYAAETVSPK